VRELAAITNQIAYLQPPHLTSTVICAANDISIKEQLIESSDRVIDDYEIECKLKMEFFPQPKSNTALNLTGLMGMKITRKEMYQILKMLPFIHTF
jgi:hypothetical protein